MENMEFFGEYNAKRADVSSMQPVSPFREAGKRELDTGRGDG